MTVRRMPALALHALSLLLIISVSCVNAADLAEGEKTISLIDASGGSLDIGKITFKHREAGVTYDLAFEEGVFHDEFLSMRPFKCIHQPGGKMLCHLAYPYRKKGHISSDDLKDLEYDLLFLHKSQDEYGINAWNGLYYLLTPTDSGFEGQLMEVDLNVLAAPPEDEVLRPVTSDMLYEADPSVHMFPRLIIR